MLIVMPKVLVIYAGARLSISGAIMNTVKSIIIGLSENLYWTDITPCFCIGFILGDLFEGGLL